MFARLFAILAFVIVCGCLVVSNGDISEHSMEKHLPFLPIPPSRGWNFPIYPPVPYQPIGSSNLYLPPLPYQFGSISDPRPSLSPYPPPPTGLIHRPPIRRDLKYTTEETLKNNPTDRMDPSVHYAILRYMPNLPIELAYVLYNMDPGFVEYIINGHQNLPHLLMAMDAVTLRYLLLHVSNFGARVSAFEDAAVQNIFGKMPSPCVYLSTLDRNIIETIIAKAPFLSVCRPQLEVDLSQIGRFEPKLPAIMELADPKKLNAMRTLHPDFTKKLSKMVEKYRAFFNMDVGKTTAKDVKQILVFKSKTEPFFAQLARLF
ncbi:hypothetical protein Aperf_G00000000811 [Anoplocephala perfoliata]